MKPNYKYPDVLRIMAENLESAYIQSNKLCIEYETSVLSYHPYNCVFYVRPIGDCNTCLMTFLGYYTYYGNTYYTTDGEKLIETPETKDEWFNFSLVHDTCENDHDNFIKIFNYYEILPALEKKRK